MRNLLFVHGTGVREASYQLTLEFITGELKAEIPQLAPRECYWGKSGASLHQNGDSIPTYSTARAVDGPDPAQEALTLWRLLFEDPFFELRYLATQPPQPADLPPNVDPPSVVLAARLKELQPEPALSELLEKYRLLDLWQSSLAAIRDEPATSTAIGVNQEDTNESRQAVARAIVASLLAAAMADGRPMPQSEVRDRMVDLVLDGLGGRTRSVQAWLGGQLLGLAASASSFWIKRKRGKISDAGLPALGDILLYQTRGDDIRTCIRERILKTATTESAVQPIVVLAHSLGGIACVDLLAKEDLPVSHLITCGSQAPLLFEIDSLVSLRYGTTLRPDFPRWLNIYDENDFLSYVGAKVFAGKVKDVRVESRQPFPESHSAYWTNRNVWTSIATFLREDGS
jgi:hypothetical protein